MQTEAPAVFDITSEPQETRDLYGYRESCDGDSDAAACSPAAWSRRALRFVCAVSGGGPGNPQWDAQR